MAGEARTLRVLHIILCVLCTLRVCSVRGHVDYCRQLEELVSESGPGRLIKERALSERGKSRVLALSAIGDAPEAARALLHALLQHSLRYRSEEILLVNYTLADLQQVNESNHESEFILSMSSAWREESTSVAQCRQGACDVAGTRLSVLGSGVAPVARRLLARLAPGAPADCLSSWARLRTDECGFTTLRNTTGPTPCSDWPANSTCHAGAACVVVALVPGGDGEACRLARALPAVRPLHLARMSKLHHLRPNRSLLFVDYMWSDRDNHGSPAPPPGVCANASDACSAAPQPLPLALGDVHKLTRYAQPVLNLALRFRPPPALLRSVLEYNSSLGLKAAACQAIVARKASIDLARSWLTCDDSFCDRIPEILIYLCEGEPLNAYYRNVTFTVYEYWRNTTNQLIDLGYGLSKTDCSNTDGVNWDLHAVMGSYEYSVALRGLVAMGAAAASQLPKLAAEEHLPLLLVAAPPGGVVLPTGARSSAPGVRALAGAVRSLLGRCGWHRLALLREEGRCDIWKRSLGVAEELKAGGSLLVYTELVHPEQNASEAVSALRALDARLVLVDTSAGTAAHVLRAAERAALTPAAGFVWIVVGAAVEEHNLDWLPTTPEFSYVTVGEWRGVAGTAGTAAGEGALHGSARLRDALDDKLGRAWLPHTAALADALLMMYEGVARVHTDYPQHRNDPHQTKAQQLFFEKLDNITLEGVTHDMQANASIPVFAHRWTMSGPQLVGAWGAPGPEDRAALCGGVADGPTCYSTKSGEPFKPHCHDFAWAVVAFVLALGTPALCAARAARRHRLRLRDRAVEERALLRGGHSAAEAAAGAALAEYAVPRDALQLLDQLGAGHYGVVHQAVLRRTDSPALGVAAKTPRADAPAGAAAELLREAALLATLRHEHIVRFTGVCWEGGPLVLMEHAFYGDLRRYLRARRTLVERARAGLPEPEAAHVASPALTRLAREAAAALGYLANRRLVHRDVRAANCLVDARRSLKLADFGMARRLDQAGDGEYLCKRRAMFPVLWMAPESLARGVFSAASDVWALGVLLLELATLGERPFGAWGTARVLSHVRAGGAPPVPRDAAPSTRGMTAACWRFVAEERPTAAALVAYLAENPRAVQPALEPHADADAEPVAADTDLYIDEWE